MRAKWGHSGTASQVHHLGLGVAHQKITKEPDRRHRIARLQRPDIARANARRASSLFARPGAWRPSGNVAINRAIER